MNVADWLNLRFLDWQRAEGRRKTISEFATYLDVSQASLSDWLHGKYDPKGKNIARIAEGLGYEIYDILGIPRPLPAELDEKISQMVQAARQLSPEIQSYVVEALHEIVPILAKQQHVDKEQVMWMLADMLRKRMNPSLDSEKLASLVTGHPRIAYPIGIGFTFEHTPENIRRFKQTGIDAAKKIDQLGLDEDSEEGQAAILEIFINSGFPLLDTAGMDFNVPHE